MLPSHVKCSAPPLICTFRLTARIVRLNVQLAPHGGSNVRNVMDNEVTPCLIYNNPISSNQFGTTQRTNNTKPTHAVTGRSRPLRSAVVLRVLFSFSFFFAPGVWLHTVPVPVRELACCFYAECTKGVVLLPVFLCGFCGLVVRFCVVFSLYILYLYTCNKTSAFLFC